MCACPRSCYTAHAIGMVPLRDAFDYARRLDAPLRVIADCGHLLIGERPRAVVEAISEFLDRVLDVEELPVEGELVG